MPPAGASWLTSYATPSIWIRRTARRDITQLLGYGPVDQTRVAAAARTQVVLLGAGSINHRQRLSLPLPPALAATTEWRRLMVSLG